VFGRPICAPNKHGGNFMATTTGTILLIGASRGLGLGLASEYLARGWQVIATARDPARATGLTGLVEKYEGALRVETVDVAEDGAGAALAERLHGTTLDVIFVVAGQNTGGWGPAFKVDPKEAAHEFITNTYAPPAMAEALAGLLKPGGTVVFMTSILGSLSNATGIAELYSASKAGLNMLGIGFSKRHPDLRTILMHPGGVKSDMGGEGAPLDVPTSVTGMADVIEAQAGGAGLDYIDYAGKRIAW
jgi:NAD(P)-dependent dehydrogenase (short-subunit alcohol dehydrogenase family)